MPRRCMAGTLDEDVAPALQQGQQLLGAERVHAGCGELNRQWQAVELATDLGDRRRVGIGQFEARTLAVARSTNSSTAE